MLGELPIYRVRGYFYLALQKSVGEDTILPFIWVNLPSQVGEGGTKWRMRCGLCPVRWDLTVLRTVGDACPYGIAIRQRVVRFVRTNRGFPLRGSSRKAGDEVVT